MKKLLLSPHNDDEALFAAFTVIRERPHVVVCFRGAEGYGDPAVRADESWEALAFLGAVGFEQWDLAGSTDEDVQRHLRALDEVHRFEHVYAPDLECTHREHAQVARCAARVFRGKLTPYHTYEHARGAAWPTRVTSDRPVEHEPEWVMRKMSALRCYKTQIMHPRISDLFLDDQREYYGVQS